MDEMLPDAWQTVSREDDTTYKLLVVLFSLEVSKFQVALRSLSSEVGIKSGYLKTDRISNSRWKSLG
ncbi:hypothetical protein [Nostoc sp.]|uniref:hypothetical protein n=1 Tax=Nostoc sp. TaxID=1180 RepID=UPI002FF69FD6